MNEIVTTLYFDKLEVALKCVDELKEISLESSEYILEYKIEITKENTFILNLNIIATCLN